MFPYVCRLIHIILQVIHTISQTVCLVDTAVVNCGLYLIINESVITFVSPIANDSLLVQFTFPNEANDINMIFGLIGE